MRCLLLARGRRPGGRVADATGSVGRNPACKGDRGAVAARALGATSSGLEGPCLPSNPPEAAGLPGWNRAAPASVARRPSGCPPHSDLDCPTQMRTADE